MNQKIIFRDPESLAHFIAAFLKTTSTATFEVTENTNGTFSLEFTGGY